MASDKGRPGLWDSAMVTFYAVSASAFGGARGGSEKDNLPGLTYDVRLQSGESVQLQTGGTFADINGKLTVRREDAARAPAAEGKVGLLFYYEEIGLDWEYEPANYRIEVFVSPANFEELVATARLGRLPASLKLEVEGLKYGSAPDGSAKVWDNKDARCLPIRAFSYGLPLVVPPAEGDDIGDEEAALVRNAMPPTRAQFDQLAARLDRLIAQTRAGLKAVQWAVIGLGVLYVLFRLF